LFLFIYQAIVLAEENFLRKKFGSQFEAYCKRVNRWWINFNGLSKTIKSMAFNGKRWLIKEYNTQTVWLLGIVVILLYYYPQLTKYDEVLRDRIGMTAFAILAIYYLTIRYLKKSGKWKG
jgi:protein-S-isoprenylcysteine O-methyltransferase Ste14